MLVIVLAEATLDLMIPWVDAGLLPSLKGLITNGSHGPLSSRFPLITPQLFGTLVTGKSPGYHGLFDFWHRGPDGRFFETKGSDLKEKPIWTILSDRGIRSGIVNIPFTYPPKSIDGFMISGEDAPGSHRSIASPASLYDEIVKKFGRYRLKDIFPGGRKKLDYLSLVEEDISWQTEVLEYLISEKDWDFFLTFYSATAITQHYFWSDMESGDEGNPCRSVIEIAYRCLDKAIGRLMRAAGPESIIFIISECGAGPLKSGVQINNWLEKEGFLSRRTKSSGSSLIHPSLNNMRSVLRKVMGYTRKMAQRRLPPLAYFLVNSKMSGLKAWLQSYLADSGIDWDNTQAFSRGKEGTILINLRGRDPFGKVNPGIEFESLRTNIIERLSELVDPATGEKAVDRVYRAEELYQGPMLAWAPDLIIEWSNTAYQPTESEEDRESIFVPRWREYMNWPTTGAHRIDGILIAKGPPICRAKRVNGASIIDLMPTWLHLLNQKIPSDLEGRVMSEIFISD